jgi:hypothetical protein
MGFSLPFRRVKLQNSCLHTLVRRRMISVDA